MVGYDAFLWLDTMRVYGALQWPISITTAHEKQHHRMKRIDSFIACFSISPQNKHQRNANSQPIKNLLLFDFLVRFLDFFGLNKYFLSIHLVQGQLSVDFYDFHAVKPCAANCPFGG